MTGSCPAGSTGRNHRYEKELRRTADVRRGRISGKAAKHAGSYFPQTALRHRHYGAYEPFGPAGAFTAPNIPTANTPFPGSMTRAGIYATSAYSTAGRTKNAYSAERRRGNMTAMTAWNLTRTNLFIRQIQEKIFKMKFDVIIGNPPYQLSDGGAQASAIPIYQKFVDVAKRLNPRFLSMIIPARWFAGGRGLDSFRSDMLHDRRIRYLDDYFNAEDCFPGIDISGGVCYFLWDRDNFGECEIVSHLPQATTTMIRPLLEEGASTYIRFNQAVEIYRKVCLREGFASFSSIVSSQKPFGLRTYILGDAFSEKKSIRIYSNRNTTKEVGYVSIDEIVQNRDWVNKYKVLVSSAYGERGEFPYHVIGKPFIAEKNTCCSETYLVIGVSDSKNECKNITTSHEHKVF